MNKYFNSDLLNKASDDYYVLDKETLLKIDKELEMLELLKANMYGDTSVVHLFLTKREDINKVKRWLNNE